ncbi:hypothetical protein V8F33_011827 [Rhypophila sp. PSN 637]
MKLSSMSGSPRLARATALTLVNLEFGLNSTFFFFLCFRSHSSAFNASFSVFKIATFRSLRSKAFSTFLNKLRCMRLPLLATLIWPNWMVKLMAFIGVFQGPGVVKTTFFGLGVTGATPNLVGLRMDRFFMFSKSNGDRSLFWRLKGPIPVALNPDLMFLGVNASWWASQ